MNIGVIKYINSLPLYTGLEKYGTLVFDSPRGLTNRFSSGELDLTFLPSIEYLKQQSGCFLVDNISISSFKTTGSVFLEMRVPLADVRVIQADAESCTSNFVFKYLLNEQYGIQTEWMDINTTQTYDARVIIGDAALKARSNPAFGSYTYLDLGDIWHSVTKLPIVYAVCVARNKTIADEYGEYLGAARDYNLENIEVLMKSNHMSEFLPYVRGLNYYLSENHVAALNVLSEMLQINIQRSECV